MKKLTMGLLVILMAIFFAREASAEMKLSDVVITYHVADEQDSRALETKDVVVSSITIDQGDADGNGGNFNDGTIFRLSITDLVSETPFCYGVVGTINSAGDVAGYRRFDAFTCVTASVNNVNYKATAGYADLAGGILYGLLSVDKNIAPDFIVNAGMQTHNPIDNKLTPSLGGQRFSIGGAVSKSIKDVNTSLAADITEDTGTYGGDNGRRTHVGVKATTGKVTWFYNVDAPLTNGRPTQYSGGAQINF